MNKKIIGIIPERMRSTRFPGKPLAMICGKPMVQHVYENSMGCKLLDAVYVATGDQEIIDCVMGFGGNIIRTRDDHYRASNQTSEALVNLEKTTGLQYDIICMIQGDEPMVSSGMIKESVNGLLKNQCVGVTNLMRTLSKDDVNEVKVVCDKDHYALYFSRSPIPSNGGGLYKQVCVISFRRDVLKLFPTLSDGDLETVESVDMLRFLEHGIKVLMIQTVYDTFSVDTPSDLKHVESLIREGGV